MLKIIFWVSVASQWSAEAAMLEPAQGALAPDAGYGSSKQYVSGGVMQPMPDEVGSSRDGTIFRVGIPAPFGSNPYAVQESGEPVLAGLPENAGSVYTDSSANGYRIRKALLDMHNYVRKMESPAATSMTKLIWDFHLEAYSFQWAQKLCTNPSTKWFEHSPDSSNGLPSWPYRIATGENLYTSTSVRDRSEDFSDVISKWYAERDWYDWSTGEAQPGAPQPVGHWKQLVRSQITTVGCSVVSNCKSEGDWRTFVVCHYDYGNVGKDPYEPNYGGQMCQVCPAGMTCCETGLCSGRLPNEATGLGPYAPATESHEGWYECANFKRSDCRGTGAATYREKMPNDESDLEFQQCHCGKGPEPENFVDTVSHGYFWFRNRCFQAVQGQGDDLSHGPSLYDMLQQSISYSRDNSTMRRGPGDMYWDKFADSRQPQLSLLQKKEKEKEKAVSVLSHKEFGESTRRVLTTFATPPPKNVKKRSLKSAHLPPTSNLDSSQGNFTLQHRLRVRAPHALEEILSMDTKELGVDDSSAGES
eukprot:Gregarina_sp_Poly_1__904@NODE_1217_length_4752_cov_23_215795_g680_i3_p1_GENE_NODE_1217_length_4752_cov_23_215795_g680_i3NODE_1217_length_4752_cov_23_215795_g680_i3_p1_ORF_typecomplete_len531_score61_35CAP/PF00188_26/7_1e20FinO_N/PF12602_8/0_037_NODE_1217_length_4752_cov_23_215795_g680_i314993091